MKTTKHKTTKATQKPSKSTVRIIGGVFKRRQITFVDIDGLRPTPDRLRETIFNWLMGDLMDANVLDVCAGSGVLGFESLSRGAAYAVMIEKNPQQFKQLQISAQNLNIKEHTTLICQDCLTAIKNLDTPFDVIFIDPPYLANLWQAILDALLTQNLIKSTTLIYIESDKPLDIFVTKYALKQLKSAKVGQVYAGIFKLD